MSREIFDAFGPIVEYAIAYDHRLTGVTRLLRNHADKVLQGDHHFGKDTIKFYLDLAKKHHPEHLCFKDVYGVEKLQIGDSEIIISARNGMPYATPRQLIEYSRDELFKRISDVSENAHAQTNLHRVASQLKKGGDNVSSCAPFIKAAHTCFKLYNPRTKRFEKKDGDNCPNQRAGGCAERVLLYWEPYAIQKFMDISEKTGKFPQRLMVSDIVFPINGKDPEIKYFIDDRETYYSSPISLSPGKSLLTPAKRTLYTSTLPCPECTEVMGQTFLRNPEIVTEEFALTSSRHGRRGNVLDFDDIQTLYALSGTGITVCVGNIFENPKAEFHYHER